MITSMFTLSQMQQVLDEASELRAKIKAGWSLVHFALLGCGFWDKG